MSIKLEDFRWIDEVANNATLRLKVGSMLETLIRPYATSEAANIEELIAVMNANPLHEGMMDEISTALANTMMQRTAFIRNIITENIEAVYDLATAELDQLVVPVLSIQVGSIEAPVGLNSEILQSLVTEQAGRDLPITRGKVEWADLDDAAIMRGCASVLGDEAMLDLNSLIDSVPVNVCDIYNKVFRKVLYPTYPHFAQRYAPSWIFFGFIEAAIAMYLCNALTLGAFDDVTTGIDTDLTLEVEKVAIPMANTLKTEFNRRDAERRSQTIVQAFSNSNGDLVALIHSNKYQLLMDLGGQDLTLGLCMLHEGVVNPNLRGTWDEAGTAFSVDATLVEKALFRYTTTMRTATLTARMDYSTKAKRAVALATIEAINSGEMELIEPMTVEQARDAARKAIDRVVISTPDKLYPTIRDVVCNAIYPTLGALEFLTLMDDIGNADVGETPTEVATLASVQIYARWGANQLE